MKFFVVLVVVPMMVMGQMMDKDCSQPKYAGEFCNEQPQSQKFFFSAAQGVCQPFMYNGCNGNGNRFDSAQECRQFCVNGAGAQRMNQAPVVSDAERMKDACRADYDTDHLQPTLCQSTQSCPNGHDCQNGFCCPRAEYICSLTYDSGKFAVGGIKSDKYFWTPKYNTCMRFSFYGQLGNANNFPNYNSCMRVCGPNARRP